MGGELLMKIYREMIISFILMILSVPSVNADIVTTKIVKENLSKIVMIITFDSNDQPLSIGSGFYISDNWNSRNSYEKHGRPRGSGEEWTSLQGTGGSGG